VQRRLNAVAWAEAGLAPVWTTVTACVLARMLLRGAVVWRRRKRRGPIARPHGPGRGRPGASEDGGGDSRQDPEDTIAQAEQVGALWLPRRGPGAWTPSTG
jgi:hypothetical protein